MRLSITIGILSVLLLAKPVCLFASSDRISIPLYTAQNPPAVPALSELPLRSEVECDGIRWKFLKPERVGRFVNGDYYVVGAATVVEITPAPATAPGRNGSQMDIPAGLEKSGFDDRIGYDRYDASLRVFPPIALNPGHKLVSSRSAAKPLPCVLRPRDASESPVASVSILTSVPEPLPPDAFRPSYAGGSTSIYYARNLRRGLLPKLAAVDHVPPVSEFVGYFSRPWIDTVFFHFAVPAEYMPSYGREHAYVMSFAGLLLTLDVADSAKEPLLIHLVQNGIDNFGLVEQGRRGWPAHGGHGSGRKFPIILAGVLLNEAKMRNVRADFGEDMQTIWVKETLPAGTFTRTWHKKPEAVAYGGHVGLRGEEKKPGWGPHEHLPPSQWLGNHIGETYRRCCTSVGWVGEALAAKLIPGMEAAWGHRPFFAYVDRWMTAVDDPEDLQRIAADAGFTIGRDFMQGTAWRILSGGGYSVPHRTFVDEMWGRHRGAAPATLPP